MSAYVCNGCGVCGRDEPKTYVCAWCRRKVPWCFGAFDDMPDVCDDCWAEAHARDVPEVGR